MFVPGFLKERSFRYAIIGSIIWHYFWFFVISVDFYPKGYPFSGPMRIHFLGPVLTDESFNLIVETKPELSETLYQVPEEVGEVLEPEIERLGRLSPGDLVSVPKGRIVTTHLRGALGTDKEMPRRVFYEKFSIDISESPFPIKGDLAKRGILQLPDKPSLETELLSGENAAFNEAEFIMRVDVKGKVIEVQNTVSSGDPEVDLAWQKYLEAWQFVPLSHEYATVETGQIEVKHKSKELSP